MGSNMQRQAVPLLEPESPIVGTGMEARAALDSGQVLDRQASRARSLSRHRRADPDRARGGQRRELDEYRLDKFVRSNQGTCINQRPIVEVGERVEAGQPLADSQLHGQRRAGPRPQHPGRVHELGGRQLRGRDRHQRPARARGPLHQHPHREARDRVARHQARSRGDHPRHPERRRGVPQGPRRGRHHLHRRRGPAGRHPGRQDHAQGRDRADRRGAPAARDLR